MSRTFEPNVMSQKSIKEEVESLVSHLEQELAIFEGERMKLTIEITTDSSDWNLIIERIETFSMRADSLKQK